MKSSSSIVIMTFHKHSYLAEWQWITISVENSDVQKNIKPFSNPAKILYNNV